MYEDHFSHFGVRGMKWGVRKDEGGSSNSPSARAKRMSDHELQAAVKRLNLEKQYIQLAQQSESTTVSRGAGFAKSVIQAAGKQAITTYVTRRLIAALPSV